MITFSGSGWTGSGERRWKTTKTLKRVDVSLTKTPSRVEKYLNYRSPRAGGSQWYWKEAIRSWIPLVCRRTSEGERARRRCKCMPSWDQQGLLHQQCWLAGQGLEPVWEEAGHTNKTVRLFCFNESGHSSGIKWWTCGRTPNTESSTFVKVGPDGWKVCDGELRV